MYVTKPQPLALSTRTDSSTPNSPNWRTTISVISASVGFAHMRPMYNVLQSRFHVPVPPMSSRNDACRSRPKQSCGASTCVSSLSLGAQWR